MTTADLVSTLTKLSESASFNRWAGFAVTAAAPGWVELRMVQKDDGKQYAGFLHAGLIGALIDTACGFAAYTLVGPVLASHFSVNCIAPAVGDAFHCTGEVVKAGKRQVFTRAELFAADKDGQRKLVATGETILIVA
jgi:uncharacterized protein (TIGR00369 family)